MYEKPETISANHASVVQPAQTRRVLLSVVGVTAFTGLTFLGANIHIPLFPVPITLQTLFVMLAGAIIGSRRGSLSQMLYVGAGATGLPLFAGLSGGLGIIGGPTGGYLLSFLVVPFVVSKLIHRSSSIRWQVLVFTLATAIIFALGVSHLALFYGAGFSVAFQAGFLPFIPGAIFKIVAATSIYRSYRALADRRSV